MRLVGNDQRIDTRDEHYKAEYDEVLDSYSLQGSQDIRVDLLPNVGSDLSQEFVVIRKEGKYFVCTKIDCENLKITRQNTDIALGALEMIELKTGDILDTSPKAKIHFDGKKLSLL